jgi:hypothetical protein
LSYPSNSFSSVRKPPCDTFGKCRA